MSMTSGPMVPESIGYSSVLPSGSLMVEVLPAMGQSFLDGAQARHDFIQVRRKSIAAPGDHVPQVVVRQLEQLVQGLQVRRFHPRKELLEHQVQLEQAAPALPMQFVLPIGV